MTSRPAREDPACLAALEQALDRGGTPDLGGTTPETLDAALRALLDRRGAAAVPLLRALAEGAPSKAHRKTARRHIYRLEQAGIALPTPGAPAPRPVVPRAAEQPTRAWTSGVDGSGSRAVWILFEGGLGGGRRLCSLILNDEAGILEAAGGPVSRKRLDAELRALRESQKLPWVETDAARACALVREALDLHARLGTAPPPEFARWRPLFASVDAPAAAAAPADVDEGLLARSAELAELPELAGWFVDPGAIAEQALALLQARESRLVVSDQVKAEREAAIVEAVIERCFTGEARQRWARRLREMALVWTGAGREEPARLAGAAAAALADGERPTRAIPLVRALALRGLGVAAEVALGRVRLDEVSRAPRRRSA